MQAYDCDRTAVFSPATGGPSSRVAGQLPAMSGHGPGLGAAAAAALLALAVISLAGSAAVNLFTVIGATAALLYIGAAIVSGRPLVAALDLCAGVATIGIAVTATQPLLPMLIVHLLWGGFRQGWPAASPGRSFVAGWTAFYGAAALLLVFA